MGFHLAAKLNEVSQRLSSLPSLVLLLVGVYFLFDPYVWHPLCRRHRASATICDEMIFLGAARKDGLKIKGTCLVAGGSLSGLLTARAMTDHFEKVFIVEPDNQLRDRRGHVSQWAQAHFLGNVVIRALEALFPDTFLDEAVKQGAFVYEGSMVDLMLGDKRLAPVDTASFHLLGATRMGLERLLRNLMDRHEDKVDVIRGRVVGILPNAESSSVSAVMIQEGDKETYSLPVSLLIDCTGPKACGRMWLTQPNDYLSKSGLAHRPLWEAPRTSSYRPDIHYSTAIFQVDNEAIEALPRPPSSNQSTWDKQGMVFGLLPSPMRSERFAAVIHGEQGVFTLVVGGTKNQRNYVRSLREFNEAVRQLEVEVTGEPLSGWSAELLSGLERLERDGKVKVEFRPHRTSICEYHHYHELKKLPSDFVAVGDALGHVNPRYGQGINKLVSNVVTLNTLLHGVGVSEDTKEDLELFASHKDRHGEAHKQQRLPSAFAKTYFARAHERMWPIWEVCRNDDYGASTTQTIDKGDSLSKGRWMRLYNRGLYRLAAKDKQVAHLFIRMFSFDVELSPLELFHPVLFVRAVWEVIKLPFSR